MERMDFLENQSQRSIVITESVPEDKGETWETSEMKVQEIQGDKLGPIVNRSWIKVRHIIVKLLHYKNK